MLLILAGLFFVVQALLNDNTPVQPTQTGPSHLLDFKISVVSQEVGPGENLIFTNNLANLGTARTYDVIISYAVESPDGEPIDEWEESREVSGVKEYAVTRMIPSSAGGGKYRITGEIRYGDSQTAQASATFTVTGEQQEDLCSDKEQNQNESDVDCGGECKACSDGKSCNDDDDCISGLCEDGKCKAVDVQNITEEEPSCSDGKKNQGEEDVDCGGPCDPCGTCGECNDFNACTEDLCWGDECVYKPVTPCCGNGQCEEGEEDSCSRDCEEPEETLSTSQIQEKAEAMAREDYVEAAKFCNGLAQDNQRDYCFKVVAYESGEVDICNYIETPTTADICYMKFIKDNKDYSKCDKIQNVRLKSACEGLASMSI